MPEGHDLGKEFSVVGHMQDSNTDCRSQLLNGCHGSGNLKDPDSSMATVWSRQTTNFDEKGVQHHRDSAQLINQIS